MKICFVSASNPDFLGGISLFIKNLIDNLGGNHDITWIYRGGSNKVYKKDGIKYIQIKVPKILFLNEFIFNAMVKRIMTRDQFDVINTHAIWGYWLKKYRKQNNERIVHTYHGVTDDFFKNHSRKNIFGSLIYYFFTKWYSKIIERPPILKADEIICVSEKVKRKLKRLYGKCEKIKVIRTGVDLSNFKPRNKMNEKRFLGLKGNLIYGVYVGKGGYWTKGLDRAFNLSQKIFRKEKKFRLIVIGPDLKKAQKYLTGESIIYLSDVKRDRMKNYYSSCDFLFLMSRYEGGAPTLVTSEAMASGCIPIVSKSSEQEVIFDGKNGIIIKDFDKVGMKRLINLINDKKSKESLKENALKTIKEYPVKVWAKKYLKVLKG